MKRVFLGLLVLAGCGGGAQNGANSYCNAVVAKAEQCEDGVTAEELNDARAECLDAAEDFDYTDADWKSAAKQIQAAKCEDFE